METLLVVCWNAPAIMCNSDTGCTALIRNGCPLTAVVRVQNRYVWVVDLEIIGGIDPLVLGLPGVLLSCISKTHRRCYLHWTVPTALTVIPEDDKVVEALKKHKHKLEHTLPIPPSIVASNASISGAERPTQVPSDRTGPGCDSPGHVHAERRWPWR